MKKLTKLQENEIINKIIYKLIEGRGGCIPFIATVYSKLNNRNITKVGGTIEILKYDGKLFTCRTYKRGDTFGFNLTSLSDVNVLDFKFSDDNKFIILNDAIMIPIFGFIDNRNEYYYLSDLDETLKQSGEFKEWGKDKDGNYEDTFSLKNGLYWEDVYKKTKEFQYLKNFYAF